MEESDLKFFEKIVGKTHMITNSDETIGYNVDFMKSVRGKEPNKNLAKKDFNLLPNQQVTAL